MPEGAGKSVERFEQFGAIEAILFVAGEAVEIERIANALGQPLIAMDQILVDMDQHMKRQHRGIELVRLDEKIQLRTAAEYSEYVQQAIHPIQERTLTRSVLETLSIIAYKQPVTRAEIEAIKGVSADYSIQVLTNRKLITCVGRKDAVGKPKLFGTTDEFLRHFGISSMEELPHLEEIAPEPLEEQDI